MEKPQRRGFTIPGCLGHAGLDVQHVWLGGQATLDSIVYQRLHGFRRRRRQHSFMRFFPGRGDQCCGSALAQTQTLAAKPDRASAGARGTCGTKRAFQFGTKFVRATRDTRNVITDVGYDRRTGLERKHSIERRHAMNFRGSNVQPQRDIVESAGADPADAVLDRVEHGQKTMPPARGVAVERRARVGDSAAGRLASLIRARPDQSQRQRALLQSLARRLDEDPIKSSYTFSIRMAVALNSEVPDLGSTASIVSSLVAT